METTFYKYQGTGNDFILMDTRQSSSDAVIALAKRLCDRHFGVGADGLILLEDSDRADTKMRIINSDGSEPQMCGNGIRCFAKYVYDLGVVKNETFTVETLAGVLVPTVILNDGEVTAVTVDMGPPTLEAPEVPVTTRPSGRCVDVPITVAETSYRYTAVSMGNPHAVTFVDDVASVDLPALGPIWEVHSDFPEKINTEFVQVHSRSEATMRVWERGAAETLACGTGACATLVAGVLTDRLDREATIHLPGGDLTISWPEDTASVWMTGPVALVYTGDITAASSLR